MRVGLVEALFLLVSWASTPLHGYRTVAGGRVRRRLPRWAPAGFLLTTTTRTTGSWSRISASSDRSSRSPTTAGVVVRSSPSNVVEDSRNIGEYPALEWESPLSMSMEDLARKVFGGRSHPAKLLWKSYYRGGILDPYSGDDDDNAEGVDNAEPEHGGGGNDRRRSSPRLGRKALRQLHEFLSQRPAGSSSTSLRESVADLASVSTSDDGTTKLLINLQNDNQKVEAVIIPWWKEDGYLGSDTNVEVGQAPTTRSEYSTLCVSSQVGCRQACSFCRTGLQGLTRSLTADEILAQVVLAHSVVIFGHRHSRASTETRPLPPIGNVVFMGMGEPADNVRAVVTATRRLVDPLQFALPPRRITVSTVSPTPDAFRDLLGMNKDESPTDSGVQLAWSLHSSRNEVRKLLVPTAKYTVEELRDGLIDALCLRPKKHRSVLIELTMLEALNDSVEDAIHLAEFCAGIQSRVDGVKLVVNLIPWNDIRAPNGPAANYRPSSQERVRAFQFALMQFGVRCYVRTTRGDDDWAACGQLATSAKLTTAQSR